MPFPSRAISEQLLKLLILEVELPAFDCHDYNGVFIRNQRLLQAVMSSKGSSSSEV
jgi:hypothetical protein